MPDLLERKVGELRLQREHEARGGLARRVGDDVELDGDLVAHRREATAADLPPVTARRSAGVSSSSRPRRPPLT